MSELGQIKNFNKSSILPSKRSGHNMKILAKSNFLLGQTQMLRHEKSRQQERGITSDLDLKQASSSRLFLTSLIVLALTPTYF